MELREAVKEVFEIIKPVHWFCEYDGNEVLLRAIYKDYIEEDQNEFK